MKKLIPIIIVGSRIDGQAGVVLDLINKMQKYKVVGFLDNTPERQGTKINGITVLGSSDCLDKQKFATKLFHIAIGDNVARGKIYDILTSLGNEVVSLIHPSAIISNNAKIGKGCFIGPASVINPGAIINDAVIINTGVIVEHDNNIGFAVHMAPGSKTAGRVNIDKHAFIGIGATIIPDICIGENAMVGAGSTVVKSIPARTTVIGYAARAHMKNIYVDTKVDS